MSHRGVAVRADQAPDRADPEVVPLSVAEVEALADNIHDRYRAVIIFAAGMGLRQGECFGLTIDRVDFLRRQVRVDRQLLGVKDGVPEFGPPKSKAGFRTVPMPDVVAEALAAHLAKYPPGPGGVVFTNSLGRPCSAAPGTPRNRRSGPAADRQATTADQRRTRRQKGKISSGHQCVLSATRPIPVTGHEKHQGSPAYLHVCAP